MSVIKQEVTDRAEWLLSVLESSPENMGPVMRSVSVDIPALIMVLCALCRASGMSDREVVEGVRAFQRDVNQALRNDHH